MRLAYPEGKGLRVLVLFAVFFRPLWRRRHIYRGADPDRARTHWRLLSFARPTAVLLSADGAERVKRHQ
jgi:hypothetical protein